MKRFILLLVLVVTGLWLPSTPALARSNIYLPSVAMNAPCSFVTEIPQSECKVLVSLYNQTNGPQWAVNEGWLTDNHPCEWHGITCEEGHVVYLTLVAGYMRDYCIGNQVHGPLLPEIANLSRLRTLTSCFNTFTTPIPPEWGQLSDLEVFSFTFNTLDGPIPPELGNLTKLKVLNLRSNELSGPIPAEVGNLTELHSLVLRGNQLSGRIPEEIGNLVKIEELDFEGSAPDLCIPSSLNAFTEGIYQYWPPDGGLCP